VEVMGRSAANEAYLLHCAIFNFHKSDLTDTPTITLRGFEVYGGE